MKRHLVLSRLKSEFPSVTWEDGPRNIYFRADVGEDMMLDFVDITKHVDGLYHLELVMGNFIFFTKASFDIPNWRRDLVEKIKNTVVSEGYGNDAKRKALSFLKGT